MSESHQIGLRIRAARKARGIGQSVLAEQVGVTRTSVSNWERGANEPTAGNLADIARVLGVTAQSLRTGEAPRVARVAEGHGHYAARPIPRVPPKAYQLIYHNTNLLEAAGVPEDLVDEARRLMSGETFNTLRAGGRDDRTEDDWMKDVKAAWAFIRDTLVTRGYDL